MLVITEDKIHDFQGFTKQVLDKTNNYFKISTTSKKAKQFMQEEAQDIRILS
jgi:hypothetical protein